MSDAAFMYNAHSSAINRVYRNYAPVAPPHHLISEDGVKSAAADFWGAGEAKKPDILAFIRANVPASNRAAAAAERTLQPA